VARRPDGGICHRCYRRDPEVVEECRGCGRVRNPAVRLPDGGVLCIGCWERPLHTCVSCGTTAPAALLAEEGAYCHLCYNRHRRPLRECGKCGRTAKIARNARDGQPDLCDRCYRGPEQECSRCRRVRPCTRVASGEPICHACYHRDERPLVNAASNASGLTMRPSSPDHRPNLISRYCPVGQSPSPTREGGCR
jgi:hypothetical protein